MKPYICEGTTIKTTKGREGKIIGVDRKTGIFVAHTGKVFFTDKLENIVNVSYKGVM